MPDSLVQGTVAKRVLPEYYRTVCSLPQYLGWGGECGGAETAAGQCTGERRADVPDGIVCVRGDSSGAAPSGSSATAEGRELALLLEETVSSQSLLVVLRQVQLAILRDVRSGRRKHDVLTLGYREDDSSSGTALVSVYPNAMVTRLLTDAAWFHMYRRLGPERFFQLLLTTSFFARVPDADDCFVQMWGVPLPDLRPLGTACKRKAEAPLPRRRRRRRTAKPGSPVSSGGTSGAPVSSAGSGSAASTFFDRSRLFYARPARVYRFGIVLGLPPAHVFNSTVDVPSVGVPPGVFRRRSSVRAPPLRERVREVCRSIWPAQFGLPPAWERRSDVRPTSARRSRRALPRRLAPAAPLIAAMLRRHDRLHYHTLLDACCPNPLPRGRLPPGSRDQLASHFAGMAPAAPLPRLPEVARRPAASGAALTQRPAAAPVADLPERRRQQEQLARSRSRGEPRFYQYATSMGRVAWFAVTVLRRVVPLALLGSAHNRRVVERGVARLVCARRHERVALHTVLQQFRTSDCEWMHGVHGQRAPVSEQRKRAELAQALVFWLLDRVVLPLLSTTFYVTEAAAFRQRVLYFRQDVWARLSTPLVARLRDALFEQVPQTRASRRMPYSTVRLLPKDTTVRAIVNLRRRLPLGGGPGVSVNASLQPALDVLGLVRQQAPHLWGASVSSGNEIFARLLAWKRAQLSAGGRLPHLFFVKADVRAAFDSMDHARLLAVVRRVLDTAPPAYVIQRFTQVKPGLGRLTHAHVRRALEDDAYPVPITDVARSARHAVIVDGVVHPLEERERVWESIRRHVTHNLVALGTQLYRQRVGVPQGSVLSTALCNLLLADVEQRYLAPFTAHGCLLRYTDDFLYITPSRSHAEGLCRRLHDGFPGYGCSVAREKTLVNFDMFLPDGSGVSRIPPTAPFPWCGYTIRPADLAVQADLDRYPGHLADSLSVRTAGQPGVALAAKLLQSVRSRTHVLYTDTALCTAEVAYGNLFEGFVLAAAKLHAYCRALRPASVSAPFLLRSVRSAVRHTYPMLAARARRARASNPGACCTLQRTCVDWLGLYAFWLVLSRKQAHADVSAALERLVRAARYAKARAEVGSIAVRTWPALAERLARVQY